MDRDDLLGELIATAQHRTREVSICARGDLVERHLELSAALAAAARVATDASLASDNTASDLAGQIVAVEEELEAASVTFVISSVSRKAWADLLATHGPLPQHKGADHNTDTFPPAAVALCCKSPSMSYKDAMALADAIPAGEFVKLWNATWLLNTIELPRPKLAAATELARVNGTSSTTPVNAASLGPSSSDGNASQ